MRLFEILFSLLFTITMISLFFPARNRPSWMLLFPLSLPFLFFIHLFAESLRWQMIPLYLFSLIVCIVYIIQTRRKKRDVKIFFSRRKKSTAVIGRITVIILIIAVIIPPVLIPVFTFPRPTGPFHVGTSQFHVIDTQREEILTEEPGDVRQFMVRMWYPCRETNSSQRARYWDNAALMSKERAALMGLPFFIFQHFNLVKTWSLIDTPLAEEKEIYPVILSLHGGECGASATDNVVINEELASRGFVVAGLSHPYSSLMVRFPDGNTIPYNRERIERLHQQSKLSESLWKEFFNKPEQGVVEKKDIIKKIFGIESILLSDISLRSMDVMSVLHWLERMNEEEDTILSNKLNLNQIGIFGFDLGGTVSMNSCIQDTRIKACINIGGYYFGDLLERKINQPIMIIRPNIEAYHVERYFLDNLKGPYYILTLDGATGKSFNHRYIYSPLSSLFGYSGSIKGIRMTGIIRDYISSFFHAYLIGGGHPLQDLPSGQYPEVDVKMVKE
jgi:predicted dienelactone hydrolase